MVKPEVIALGSAATEPSSAGAGRAFGPPLKISSLPRVPKMPAGTFAAEHRDSFKPVVIEGAIAHWRALTTWSHEWFKTTHGSVEVGLSVNPTHTMRVMKTTLAQYIDLILSGQRTGNGLYLDQYPVERIPSLLGDIETPIYCPPGVPITTNLWLGPSTTVLSFHKDNHDPHTLVNNIFVQIKGRKRILLAAPDQDQYMYPRGGEQGAYWHSQVDPERPDAERFPLFFDAQLQEAIVGPGDILFIPGNYWHYVRALERSISLSFWWHTHNVSVSTA